jgi:hypothetical protein
MTPPGIAKSVDRVVVDHKKREVVVAVVDVAGNPGTEQFDVFVQLRVFADDALVVELKNDALAEHPFARLGQHRIGR